VRRLPERSLTKLLLLLKEDMQKKAAYLKYLKVSAKFIEACDCEEKVHAYCLTAQVTRSQKIHSVEPFDPDFNHYSSHLNLVLLLHILG
jgi:hypothetical protein